MAQDHSKHGLNRTWGTSTGNKIRFLFRNDLITFQATVRWHLTASVCLLESQCNNNGLRTNNKKRKKNKRNETKSVDNLITKFIYTILRRLLFLVRVYTEQSMTQQLVFDKTLVSSELLFPIAKSTVDRDNIPFIWMKNRFFPSSSSLSQTMSHIY